MKENIYLARFTYLLNNSTPVSLRGKPGYPRFHDTNDVIFLGSGPSFNELLDNLNFKVSL